jgi:3-oxoacyl-ACP reductase-like protein
MKLLKHGWSEMMRKTVPSLALIAFAGVVLAAPMGFAQQATQNAQGVSNPPADDSIVTSTDDTAPAAKPSPSVKPAAAAAPQQAPAPAAAPAIAPATAPAPQAAPNPDDDIVSSVPANTAAEPAPAPGAKLESRPYNPDQDIVGYVPSSDNELAEGTNIRVRMLDALSTQETTAGSAFKAQVASDVYKNGKVIIPAGSELRGRVVSVSQGHHFGPSATLRLRPDVVILPDGTAYHLYAQVVDSKAPNTRTDSEGGIEPASHATKKAVEYGAGAGTGAIVGAEVGGPTGALVGSLVGAGVVTAHLLMQHPQMAALPKGSIVTFSLTEPMDLLPTRN